MKLSLLDIQYEFNSALFSPHKVPVTTPARNSPPALSTRSPENGGASINISTEQGHDFSLKPGRILPANISRNSSGLKNLFSQSHFIH